MREETNIIVNVVDFKPIFDKLKNDYIKQYPHYKEKEFSLYIPESWGFVETEKGKLMICSEGVVDDKPISITTPFNAAIYLQETEPEQTFSMFPIGMIRVSDIKEIEELPVISKQPLEKFVRAFGYRLEINFNLCKNYLKPIVRS